MKKLLLVEDNAAIREALSDTFTEPEYQLHTADCISRARAVVNNDRPGLVLLDVTLPDGSGFSFYETVLAPAGIPAIFLTAKDEERDIVSGLELGAEDYITKPFSVRELVARVNRVFLRQAKPAEITVQGIHFDLARKEVRRGDTIIAFSRLELRILMLLAEQHDQAVSRDAVIDCIWEATGNDVYDHTVTVYMKRIREKLGVDIIKTVKGIGYRIDTQ